MTRQYARPEALVSTEYIAEHLNDPNMRIVEVDTDTTAYNQGHIPGAVGWNWNEQLCDTRIRDIVPKNKLEELLGNSGIDNNTTIVLYGDNNNWFAAWAFWQLKMYGHKDVRLMNGGRKKWLAENRSLTTDMPNIQPKTYRAEQPDLSLRTFLPEVRHAVEHGAGTNGVVLVDVRGPQEYSGEILAPPDLPETCQRGGHIPGAKNIPWGKACNDDGTFKDYDELATLYSSMGVTPDKQVITYCRIGERSSHSWFALRYLLGYSDVKNYDGSWTEWGNLVGAPI
jgi:thiosulfate/3-mercaptopyruvate sulfurtransferase